MYIMTLNIPSRSCDGLAMAWREDLSVSYDVRYKAGPRQDAAVLQPHEGSVVAAALGMILSDTEDTLLFFSSINSSTVE